jgi:hypothetical protein
MICFSGMKDHVSLSTTVPFDTDISIDTGARPFACNVCNQQFTRPDSLVRHRRRHEETFSNAHTLAPEPRASTEVHASHLEAESSAHESQSPSQSRGYIPNSTYQVGLDEVSLDQEPFSSLNWPDSEDLLNSILSAEFTSLPSLEVLPSQSFVRGTEDLTSQPVSPWLTADLDQSQVHGGNHAVQNLSQMINSLVGH